MTTVRDDVKAVLEADETLAGLLAGGVHAAIEISRQGTPDAFDANGEILPCALVKVENESKAGPYPDSARTFVLIYWYERAGTAAIDQARERARVILHRERIGGGWEMAWTDDLTDLEDQGLACSLTISRYQKHRRFTV